MNNNALLASLGITRTRFASIALITGADAVPLGQGGCKAVILKANQYKYDSTDRQAPVAPPLFYYGDEIQQPYEYLMSFDNKTSDERVAVNFRSSELIICEDINQVWLRLPPQISDPLEVVAIIYS